MMQKKTWMMIVFLHLWWVYWNGHWEKTSKETNETKLRNFYFSIPWHVGCCSKISLCCYLFILQDQQLIVHLTCPWKGDAEQSSWNVSVLLEKVLFGREFQGLDPTTIKEQQYNSKSEWCTIWKQICRWCRLQVGEVLLEQPRQETAIDL